MNQTAYICLSSNFLIAKTLGPGLLIKMEYHSSAKHRQAWTAKPQVINRGYERGTHTFRLKFKKYFDTSFLAYTLLSEIGFVVSSSHWCSQFVSFFS